MAVPSPRLHHAPASGWVNDPLALTWHEGRYHLFFQYVPESTVWTLACRWGHATSDDLLSWDPAPVALEPGDGDDGVWSGNLVRPADGDPVAFYTAVTEPRLDHGRVRRAVPVDADWTSWHKEEVVVEPPEDDDVLAFRDPFVQRYGAGWRMLIGGGLASGEGAVWGYESADLRTWTPLGRLAADAEMSATWECPVLVEVGGRTVLVVSALDPGRILHVGYAFVDDHGDRFDLGPWQRLTYGPSLYAASTFADAEGEPGLVAWLREVGDVESGWMGAHSLPVRVRTSGDRLVAAPPPALAARRAGRVMEGLLPAVADLEWAPLPGDVLVAEGRCRLDAVGETVAVTVDAVRHELPWSGEPLRMVLDGPVLEVFGELGWLAVPVPATGSRRRTDRVDRLGSGVHRLGDRGSA